MRKILIILFLLQSPQAFSQIWGSPNWGATCGVHLRLGTHVNRIGLSAQVYGGYQFFQVNYAWQGYFALENWGKSQKLWEMQNNNFSKFCIGKYCKTNIFNLLILFLYS